MAVPLATAALVASLAPSSADARNLCVTGQGPYTGCTFVVFVPGTYCYARSQGEIAGRPYWIGPGRCWAGESGQRGGQST